MGWTMVLAAALIAADKSAQFQADRFPGPAEATAAAAADLATIDELERKFFRYLWVPPWGKPEWPWGVSFVVNSTISRSSLPYIPQVRATEESGAIVRIDLRKVAASGVDVAEAIELWESLAAIEPYFSIVAEVEVAGHKGKQRAAAPAAHAGLTDGTLLRGMAQSAVPIVRADWFTRIALSNTEGGLYYELAGVQKSPDKNLTDQAFWWAKFGIDEKASKAANKIRSVVILLSAVTDKQRRADYLEGASLEGGGWITHDGTDEDRDVAQLPLPNLVAFKDAAREAFAFRQNGLLEYALFDAKGELQRTVPDNVARDHTIPSPHTNILQPAVSCIRCHGPADGFLPLPNDLKAIVDDGGDVFGDLSRADIEQTNDELASRYLKGLDKFLERSREDYTEAVMRSTNGRLDAQEVAETVAEIYGGYQYQAVTPKVACRELGYELREGVEPAKAFKALVPRLPPELAAGELKVSFDDPHIQALRAGRAIKRTDWERIYADVAFRAMKSQDQPQNAQTVAVEQKTEITRPAESGQKSKEGLP